MAANAGTLNNTQELVLAAAVTAVSGAAVSIIGVPGWYSEDESILFVTAAPGDPLKAVVRTLGAVGTTRVRFECTVAGTGGTKIGVIGLFTVTVTDSGKAVVNFTIVETRERTA